MFKNFQSTIDMLDGNGYTALQIVCEGEMRKNTLEIAKLLLEKKVSDTLDIASSSCRYSPYCM